MFRHNTYIQSISYRLRTGNLTNRFPLHRLFHQELIHRTPRCHLFCRCRMLALRTRNRRTSCPTTFQLVRADEQRNVCHLHILPDLPLYHHHKRLLQLPWVSLTLLPVQAFPRMNSTETVANSTTHPRTHPTNSTNSMEETGPDNSKKMHSD